MSGGRRGIGSTTRWLAALGLVVLSACDEEPVALVLDTTAETEPSLAPAPTRSPVAVPSTSATPDAFAGAESWTVVDIVDGDTLWVTTSDGTRREVRLIGVDTPERGVCFADQATDGLSFFAAPGTAVQLVGDVSETDRYGRLLRYVEVVAADGTVVDVGAELVGGGFAVAKQYPPDTARAHIYELRQAEAQQLGRGQWAPGACTPPTTLPPAPATVPPVAVTTPPAIVPFATIPAPTNCHPSYPTVCIPGGPDLDCGDISARRFEVVPPDPHRFDGDGDGIGCESG